jgi:hypothetical protein
LLTKWGNPFRAKQSNSRKPFAKLKSKLEFALSIACPPHKALAGGSFQLWAYYWRIYAFTLYTSRLTDSHTRFEPWALNFELINYLITNYSLT